MSTPSETTSLIKPPSRRKRSRCCLSRVHYRLPRIKEKGAIVVIVCNLLIVSAAFMQIHRIYLMSSTFSIILPLMSITFPIAGIVADTCVGKFRVVQAGIAFLIVSSLVDISLIYLQDYFSPTATNTLVLLIEILCPIGGGCYFACALPFIGDQLIGASG